MTPFEKKLRAITACGITVEISATSLSGPLRLRTPEWWPNEVKAWEKEGSLETAMNELFDAVEESVTFELLKAEVEKERCEQKMAILKEVMIPIETSKEPLRWNPMDTCPREPDGRLTEGVWIARMNFEDDSPQWWGPGSWLDPDFDDVNGRIGWLPASRPRPRWPQ